MLLGVNMLLGGGRVVLNLNYFTPPVSAFHQKPLLRCSIVSISLSFARPLNISDWEFILFEKETESHFSSVMEKKRLFSPFLPKVSLTDFHTRCLSRVSRAKRRQAHPRPPLGKL